MAIIPGPVGSADQLPYQDPDSWLVLHWLCALEHAARTIDASVL